MAPRTDKEYIDKHEAYILLKHEAETHELPASKEAYERAMRIISMMKPCEVQIDAPPMKRGKWRLVAERVMTNKYACSECDSIFAIPRELAPEGFYCYCPKCGAKMYD